VRIVRLSNVVGLDFRSSNFIYDLIRSACDSGEIRLRSALTSEKDYVRLDDVLDLLPRIATSGTHVSYNLGSGQNLSHATVVGAILAHSGARLNVSPDAPVAASRPLDIERLRNEFGYSPRTVLDYIPHLIDEYRQQRK
jgi:nucleoside-diphosphate-sugar epimerase